MLFGLFKRGPQNTDDLERIRNRIALRVTSNHLNQLDRDVERHFRQRFQSPGDQLCSLGQQTLYLRQHGDNIVACDAAGNVHGVVEGPLASTQAGPSHQDQNFGAPTNLGNSYVPGQQVTHDIGVLQTPEPTQRPFFPPEGASRRPPTLQPSGHLTLPSPPPSGEPSLSLGSRPASRNNDTGSLSSINQILANDEMPQPAQVSTTPSQRVWVNSTLPNVLTSVELAPKGDLRPSLQTQNGGEADTLSPLFSRCSPYGEDIARLPGVSNHSGLDRAPLGPSSEAIAADTYDEARKVFLDALDNLGTPKNQPHQTTSPIVEDSDSSTMEALRTWGATMCEILKEQITRCNRETESLASVLTGSPATSTRFSLLESRFKLLGALTRLSFALGAAYHVPPQVLLDTNEGLQRCCFEMHRPRTQQEQLAFLSDLLQGVEALVVELQSHINSPTTPSDLQRLSLPWSMRSNGAEYQGAAGAHALAQLAVHRDGNRYLVDDRSPPTINAFPPNSQATSPRLSYAGSPQLRGDWIANGGAVMNDHITLVVDGGPQRAVPNTDGILNNSTQDETPLSQMRMLQRPRGSFTWPRTSHQAPETGNPSIIHDPPAPTAASSNPVEVVPAPIPVLVTADVPLQHPHPERHYQQAEFMASPSWLKRLRLANLLNIPPFWK